LTSWSPSLERNPRLDSWIHIQATGRITIFTGKVELGQGIKAALARIAAEELDVALDRIEVETADTDRGPNELYTAGSGSVEESGNAIRQAAASARALLLERAAQALRVPRKDLRVEDGCIHSEGGPRTSYWELFGDRNFGCDVSRTVQPKPFASYRVVGTPEPRPDLRELVTGRTRFAADLEMPGMVYGRVVRPPSRHAALIAVDRDALRATPGLLATLIDGRFLGVIAEREEQAIRAQQTLRDACRWEETDSLPPEDRIFECLIAGPHESLHIVEGAGVEGPIPAIEIPEAASVTHSARYQRPYHMHASIGPAAAMARLSAGKLTVWTSSQGIHLLRLALAQVLKMPADDIRVIHAPGPGCYGHNGADDAALDAVLLARALPERPVLLQWTREDEHAWEPYGPAMVVDLQAGLDERGQVVAWSHDVYSNTHMGRPLPYGDRSNLLGAWLRDPPMPPPNPRPESSTWWSTRRCASPRRAASAPSPTSSPSSPSWTSWPMQRLRTRSNSACATCETHGPSR
jgi:CO/xanthine dehydrogenase Mo-binding subunit